MCVFVEPSVDLIRLRKTTDVKKEMDAMENEYTNMKAVPKVRVRKRLFLCLRLAIVD